MPKPKPFPKFPPVSPRATRRLARPLLALGALCSLAGCALFGGGGESVATARARATPLPTATAPAAQVSREGDALVYAGPLDAAANAEAQRLYANGVRRLVINSRGGTREAAMALGEWMFEHGLDVEVSGACLAACARYVFPAGRQKLLGASSQLAWDGRAGPVAPAPAEHAREAAYFARLGVDPRATDWGLRPEYARHHAHCAGWRYGLVAMEQLGMRNVHVTAPRWQPADLVDERCIFVIDTLAPAPGSD